MPPLRSVAGSLLLGSLLAGCAGSSPASGGPGGSAAAGQGGEGAGGRPGRREACVVDGECAEQMSCSGDSRCVARVNLVFPSCAHVEPFRPTGEPPRPPLVCQCRAGACEAEGTR